MLIASLLLAASLNTPIPLDRARNAFAEARLASGEDGGRMWGRALYGPMIFVDPQSRFAVANQADNSGVLKAQDGVFAGTLPLDDGDVGRCRRTSGVAAFAAAPRVLSSHSG